MSVVRQRHDALSPCNASMLDTKAKTKMQKPIFSFVTSFGHEEKKKGMIQAFATRVYTSVFTTVWRSVCT